MRVRGVAGLVSDGVVRDMAGVLNTELPVWCSGAAAPASIAGLTFINWQEPIACGGVAVFPDDVVVVDEDGAVLIPQKLLEAVAVSYTHLASPRRSAPRPTAARRRPGSIRPSRSRAPRRCRA